ncbi:MAG: single-stranded DNA-binding protein [Candidatus Cloacimonetes bacterium]|nr:single-stranded DNA-binding protein [Candidatus Cloacimonadota bacterium]
MKLNDCKFIGRLVADSQLSKCKDGQIACKFKVAVNSYKKDSDPLYLPIICFEKTAEFVSNYLTKGSLVFLSGRLDIRKYENKEGQESWYTSLLAHQVQSLTVKNTQEAA